ncbi:MAG: bifunctional diaminohydroxyphosphoribosylaminopyrimidine deaminase/5-amino-6-(5-phosphoribosylamino)uracil reductase RibD [Sulfuricaulis sp.]|uniref:bifunctional diaminohydroxyphosphoribosylaminopyrimidine deaminase/5-amino-6-(5-phosphoribosylamino)uracil reductase RibD n=1 Tax=Sulfuricaulis sp. TaxID=2003553 RepID=UPI003C4BD60E
MTTSAADARFMARALQLARRGMYTTDPNPRVGCVIVKDGKIIGEGWHERAGEPHAEVNALNQAGKIQAHSAGVYLTLEPCCHQGRTPPCTQALIKAGVTRVVAAMRDPNPQVAGKGIKVLESHGIRVDVGLMEKEAETLNPGFVSRMKRGRPYVRVKLAASADGRTAMANGESKWITGEAARADVQKWRARSSAILTGVSTVLADDPSLNVRDIKTGRQPLRVVVDSRLRMPVTARMLRGAGKTLVITASQDMAITEKLKKAGAEIADMPTQQKTVDLGRLMKHLAWLEMNEVLVEAGATLCGALLRANLVDELVLYYAPQIMGNNERGMFALTPLARMADRVNLEIMDVRPIGKDWRVIARVSEK